MLAGPGAVVVITGSIYLVGEVMRVAGSDRDASQTRE